MCARVNSFLASAQSNATVRNVGEMLNGYVHGAVYAYWYVAVDRAIDNI